MKYIEELKELAKLKDDGILTEGEFQKKKEEILSKSTPSKPIAKKAYSKKTKKSATKKIDGQLTKALGSVMKEGSPELKRAAKKDKKLGMKIKDIVNSIFKMQKGYDNLDIDPKRLKKFKDIYK